MQTPTMPREKGFFAARLKALRLEAQLSQQKLADESGLAVNTIRQFEYGRREPGFETLCKLAAGLGVSLSAFDPPAEPEEKPAPRRRRKE
ncbi:MAG: helix-turn-helix transcriptional regulator [Planctomycetia bacterium]|nr:helix-turn-helix transcriptional regulator [Planctomycetia bacterium]